MYALIVVIYKGLRKYIVLWFKYILMNDLCISLITSVFKF